MPSYKVKQQGFFGGVLRVPGGRHDPVVTSKAIPKKDLPGWLEEIKEKPSKTTEKKVNATTADFMGDDEKAEKTGVDADIEAL